jgi:hypothetical protein
MVPADGLCCCVCVTRKGASMVGWGGQKEAATAVYRDSFAELARGQVCCILRSPSQLLFPPRAPAPLAPYPIPILSSFALGAHRTSTARLRSPRRSRIWSRPFGRWSKVNSRSGYGPSRTSKR